MLYHCPNKLTTFLLQYRKLDLYNVAIFWSKHLDNWLDGKLRTHLSCLNCFFVPFLLSLIHVLWCCSWTFFKTIYWYSVGHKGDCYSKGQATMTWRQMLPNGLIKVYPLFFFHETSLSHRPMEYFLWDECPFMTLCWVVSILVPNHKEKEKGREVKWKFWRAKLRLGILFQFLLFAPPVEIGNMSSFGEKM